VDLAAADTHRGDRRRSALPEVEIDIDSDLFLIEGDLIDEQGSASSRSLRERASVIRGGTSRWKNELRPHGIR
jgi:hypothetical protein